MGKEQNNYPIINMKMTGEWIRFLCKRKKITVADLQKQFHMISNQAVYAWFNGKTLPSVDNLCALSKVLHMSMDDLLVLDGVIHPFLRKNLCK